MQMRLLAIGVAAAVAALVVLGPVAAATVFTLFLLVGCSWRADMIPIIPFCFAYQWLSASSGYFFFRATGHYPGGGDPQGLDASVLLSMVGLAAILVGLRLAFAAFGAPLLQKTRAPASRYDLRKLFAVTIAAFAFSYVFELAPREIWQGGAQIISNLLALRLAFYFALLITAFEQRRGFAYVAFATAWVIAPQLLTGFSRFKEILFVILIAAAAQWRPWISTPFQQQQNRRILAFGAVGLAVMLVVGVFWSGGVKQQWRAEIWRQGETGSPIDKVVAFGAVVGRAVPRTNVGRSVETLAARMSSSALYLSYVTERVPSMVRHEDGALLGRAVANVLQPRFLFPDKKSLGGDSWLVRKYAGVAAAGDESGASIGLGYLAEFYIDFGLFGVVGLGMAWGFIGGGVLAVVARASPSREIFLAVSIALMTGFFMAFEGSFAKLLGGLLEAGAIAAAVLATLGRMFHAWLIRPSARPTIARAAPAASLGGPSR
jgi:hypothetical protein